MVGKQAHVMTCLVRLNEIVNTRESHIFTRNKPSLDEEMLNPSLCNVYMNE